MSALALWIIVVILLGGAVGLDRRLGEIQETLESIESHLEDRDEREESDEV